jgi:hypothetical protein
MLFSIDEQCDSATCDIPAEHERSATPRTSAPQHWGVSRGPQRLEAVWRFMLGAAAAEVMAAMARMLAKTFIVILGSFGEIELVKKIQRRVVDVIVLLNQKRPDCSSYTLIIY